MSSLKAARILAAAAIALAVSAPLANAQLAPLVLADRFIKMETKKALATPGHVEYCAQVRPGYRAQWNNWRTADGRVTYCSSPYYKLPWHSGVTQ
jgi:hypothetical protein